MPIYEFKCPGCGKRLELLCSMGEKGSGLVCPVCGRAGLTRVFSTFATGGRSDGGNGSSGCAGCAGKGCATCH